jgi:PAS domain S-box-containing protein
MRGRQQLFRLILVGLAVQLLMVGFVVRAAAGPTALIAVLGGTALNVLGLILFARWLSRVSLATREEVLELRRRAAELEVLSQQAPVGIITVDLEGRVLATNPTFDSMQGGRILLGSHWQEYVHPDHRTKDIKGYFGMINGEIDHYVTETRQVRRDGSEYWGTVITSPLRAPNGDMRGFISIVEDISERKGQLELAARIQRQLLPQSAPTLDGYELAGACRPAQDVAGDLYDWITYTDRYLDVTLADVVGSGVPAALVMAALRTALRAASPQLQPAERVRLAAELMEPSMQSEGLFVTLFHARLDLASGELRYVDAGHGYCEIRRPGGDLVSLPVHSLPVGVAPHAQFNEGVARLEPGETLFVYSDGLIELESGTVRLEDFAEQLDEGGSAADMVQRLLGTTPRRLIDDVTVVVLRRLDQARERRQAPSSRRTRSAPRR